MSLEAGIAVFYLIWLFRSRRIRRQAKQEGKTFDEQVEGCSPDDSAFVFPKRGFRTTKKDLGAGERLTTPPLSGTHIFFHGRVYIPGLGQKLLDFLSKWPTIDSGS
jgi:hypothetical protein